MNIIVSIGLVGKKSLFLTNLGCDLSRFSGSNDGDVVPQKSCNAIADRLDEFKAQLTDLMTCPGNELLKRALAYEAKNNHKTISIRGEKETRVDIIKLIIDTRFKSQPSASKIISSRRRILWQDDVKPETAKQPFTPDLKKMNPKILKFKDSDKWDVWVELAHYLGFGDFCRKCSKLGGFKQC